MEKLWDPLRAYAKRVAINSASLQSIPLLWVLIILAPAQKALDHGCREIGTEGTQMACCGFGEVSRVAQPPNRVPYASSLP